MAVELGKASRADDALAADLFCRKKSPMDHLHSMEQMLGGRDRQPGIKSERGAGLAEHPC